ncbi:uncharacterized protein PHACADRAFT_188652 [Phanerochaete carnosa HHB-10118-sp]|uniref:CoA-transferase family III n=1 Tax=Phanerochaete carnosa (strain HHB-10118-sp) TaxID=650164 RepID=K5UJ21_PHACS|nr:uncharacterized protein PHACADRAFT_188652 [Phanerochaete carnosa HHB-10118-sp]EKM49556.1 hypothetical protein PHACADRAFT_188652 [Phanerochaete carnosa HHB-10118-sp]
MSLCLTDKADPAVNSSFKLGSVAQTSVGLAGLAAAYFHHLNTGIGQRVSTDARHAVLEFNGQLIGFNQLLNELFGVHRTKDNNCVRIHTNFPQPLTENIHCQEILNTLSCAPTKQAVAESLLQWDSYAFEEEVALRKTVATVLRRFEEWDAHRHACALRAPDASRRRSPDGIRALELTRIIAGPVSRLTLAAHGTNVLWVTSPKFSNWPMVGMDTWRGKRTTQLDLTEPGDCHTLRELFKDADVFLQGYRPGGLADKGFGVSDVVAARPGIVYASLNAYGWDGPWKDRRGTAQFDSLVVQAATGFNAGEAEAYAAYTGDYHAAGHLLAFGINAALCKTITVRILIVAASRNADNQTKEGGSWEVRVSLAAVGQWMRSFGQLEPAVVFSEGAPLPPRSLPQAPEVQALMVELQRSAGDKRDGGERKVMNAIKHSVILSATPVLAGEAPMRLDAHLPMWLPRSQ